MEKIYVGKIINTFGIKGELKIASDFDCPEKVFTLDNTIFINDKKHTITSVRKHQEHYLVCIDNLDNINLVLKYKGFKIYVLRDDLNLNQDEYLIGDLLNMEVLEDNQSFGKVTEVINEPINPLIKINNLFYIPLKANYIEKVDTKTKTIHTKNIKELIL